MQTEAVTCGGSPWNFASFLIDPGGTSSALSRRSGQCAGGSLEMGFDLISDVSHL